MSAYGTIPFTGWRRFLWGSRRPWEKLRCLCILRLIVCLILIGNKIGVKGHLETLRFKIYNLIDLSTQKFPTAISKARFTTFCPTRTNLFFLWISFFYFSKQCVACYRCLTRLSQLMDIRRSASISFLFRFIENIVRYTYLNRILHITLYIMVPVSNTLVTAWTILRFPYCPMYNTIVDSKVSFLIII